MLLRRAGTIRTLTTYDHLRRRCLWRLWWNRSASRGRWHASLAWLCCCCRWRCWCGWLLRGRLRRRCLLRMMLQGKWCWGSRLGRSRRRGHNAILRRTTVGRHRSRRSRDNSVAAGWLLLRWWDVRWYCPRVSTCRRHWWLLLRVRSGGRHWTLSRWSRWPLGLLLLSGRHTTRGWWHTRTNAHRRLLPLALLHLESLVSLLACTEFSRL